MLFKALILCVGSFSPLSWNIWGPTREKPQSGSRLCLPVPPPKPKTSQTFSHPQVQRGFIVYSFCVLHASPHLVLYPPDVSEFVGTQTCQPGFKSKLKTAIMHKQVSVVVTLLGPPEHKHYSSQAQKVRLNHCNVQIFFFSFFSFCFTSGVGETWVIERNSKGHELSGAIYGVNGLDKDPSEFYYSFASFKSLWQEHISGFWDFFSWVSWNYTLHLILLCVPGEHFGSP